MLPGAEDPADVTNIIHLDTLGSIARFNTSRETAIKTAFFYLSCLFTETNPIWDVCAITEQFNQAGFGNIFANVRSNVSFSETLRVIICPDIRAWADHVCKTTAILLTEVVL